MQWTPHPYQVDAIKFALARDGSGLMLDPGLGKTSITLACIDIAKSAGDINRTLVVAPLRVCKMVWPAEASKWTDFHGLKVVDLTSIPSNRRFAALRGAGDVFLINPEACIGRAGNPGVLEMLSPDFDMLVLDESTKFKDTQTRRFKTLRRAMPQFKRRMILTGTPVPNGLQDLFGQMFVVDNGESLGKYVSHFRIQFCHQHPSGFGWELNRGAADMIYRRVANRLMRLEAKDHLDMPELIPNFIEVDLPEHLTKSYKELADNFVMQMESTALAVFNAAAAGTKLRQMANGFVYDDQGGTEARVAHHLHTEKLDALEELVEEMQGRPLLVAYEFHEDAHMIQERFPGVFDLGRTKDVAGLVKKFNEGSIPVLIAHPASVGHGLNLQGACNTVCWYGITWNLEHYQQFIARIWRQGQQANNVVVHHIVCKGTKDEDVMGALKGKDMTQKKFNDAIRGTK